MLFTRFAVRRCVSILMFSMTSAAGLAAPSQPAPVPQEMLKLPVRIVDPEGKPVGGATVIPWALRCSQGHGMWQPKGFGDGTPPTLVTDDTGLIEVPYPRYAEADERVRTTEVTLSINHPEYVYEEYEFINVPLEKTGPHEVKLKRGAVVEVVPLEHGRPAALDGLHVKWSDGRSQKSQTKPTVLPNGALRIPPMPPGRQQVLLVRLEGERATRFSPLVELDLKAGETVRKEIELQPAVKIHGRLSDNVPRPVKNGRIEVRTLPKAASRTEVNWSTWAPVGEDGSFIIDGWPAGAAVQVIALCDGFMATPGDLAEPFKGLPSTAVELYRRVQYGRGLWRPDPFSQPQLFQPSEQRVGLVVRMTPMARCRVEVVDDRGHPVEGAVVMSCPNVRWWNGGSQIYCADLVRSERFLIEKDYRKAVDEKFAKPFRAVTGADGRAEMELPAGKEDFYVEHDKFEQPVDQGRREQREVLRIGETANVRIAMQPKGAEYLGDWDKLAGVLFGCTGEQCRRLLEDRGFRSKIEVVRKRFDEAKDSHDPKMLKGAYTDISAAFDALKDKEQAEIWRRKAAEQATKAESGLGESGTDAPPK